MRRVVIVGNAPLASDRSGLVDAADFVVRFNEPHAWGGKGGTRFDAWVIANSAGGRRFANRQTFLEAPYRDLPREIWFPRAVEVHQELRASPDGFVKPAAGRDFSMRILRRNRLRQPCTHFDADFYRRSLACLREGDDPPDPRMVPSAGFMALRHVLEQMEDATITLIGFTFQGWKGHPWAQEAAYVRRLAAAGRLVLAEG